MRKLALAIAVLALGAVLTGCGNNATTGAPGRSGGPSAPSPSVTATPAAVAHTDSPKPLPVCAQIWRTGHFLPRAYHGCSRSGHRATEQSFRCESGQTLLVFGHRMWAVRGGKIFRIHGQDDPHFRAVRRVCTA